MRIVFMGSPEFAVPSLEALAAAGYQIVGVYSQPDRPAGRGRALTPPPAKVAAERLGLPVYQPASLKPRAAFHQLAALRPELIVVAGYGLLLRPEVLALPAHGCLNVHPSLLPRHRGAAPVIGALLAGDEVMGVTIMQMDPGLDTGPIVAQAQEPVRPDDTAATLMDRLARIGARLLVETIPRWVAGELPAQPQDDRQATYTPKFSKADGALDWQRPAVELARRVRAFQPWPGTFAQWGDATLKILLADAVPGAAAPGEVVRVGDEPAVGTAAGLLRLRQVQLPGRRPVGGAEFLRGRPDFLGATLSSALPTA